MQILEIKTEHFGFFLQISFKASGFFEDIGLLYKHTFSKFTKSDNESMSNSIMLFDSKFNSFKLYNPLKVYKPIELIWLFCKYKQVKFELSLKLKSSIDNN